MNGRVLVLGGGTAGNALAVLLRRSGIDVEVVESTADWNADRGSGITLQGNALRVLDQVGIWPRARDSGFAFDELGIISADGAVLHETTDARTGGSAFPATLGMQRPQLQRLLIEAVRAAGVRVRLGTRAVSVRQDGAAVDVGFSDGTTGRYDLVAVAEGISSSTRELVGITDRPEPTGMAIWRAPAPRPRGVVRTDLCYDGPCFIAGYCPTGPDTVYAYLVERNRDRAELDPARFADEMRRLAAGYGGAWREIRESIGAGVNYTWFDRHLVEGSWHRGRVVLVGDAAHCCPPTLAQGAAMSLEDAAVLAELLTGGRPWDDELFSAYYQRREPRVRTVVDTSVRIGQALLDGEDPDVPGLVGRATKVLEEQP